MTITMTRILDNNDLAACSKPYQHPNEYLFSPHPPPAFNYTQLGYNDIGISM